MTDVCRTWRPRIHAWFDDEVSELDSQEVRQHLLDCADCRNEVKRLQSMREELHLLKPETCPQEVLDRMAYRFEEGVANELQRTSLFLQYWSRAAAVLLLVLGSMLVAERFVLPIPAVAEASSPREIEQAVQEILERPAPMIPVSDPR